MAEKMTDLNLAVRTKNAMEKIAERVVRRLIPPPRYATVTAIDFTNRKVTVEYPEEAGTTFTVHCHTVMPVVNGATVRVNGPIGARYVDEVLSGQVTFAHVRVHSTSDVTSADGTGVLQIGPSGAANIGIDGNEIMARSGGAAANLNINLEGGGVTIGSDAYAGLTKLRSSSEVTASDNNGILQVGADGAANLGIDGDEIQARSGGAAAQLNLNPHGGSVAVNSGSNRVLVHGEADLSIRMDRSGTGRPYAGFFNEKADSSVVRKGYIGYPTAQSDAGTGLIVWADLGEILLGAANGDVTLSGNGGSINLNWANEIQGGAIIGRHPTHTSYDSIRATNHTGADYVLLWNSSGTYLSADGGASVYIRPNSNQSTVQLQVSPTLVTVTGELGVTGKVRTTDNGAVSVHKTSNQTVTTAGEVITFTSEQYDRSANFASNRFTADADGVYLIAFQAIFMSGAGSVRLKRNGTIASTYAGYGANTTEVSGYKNVTLTAVVSLANGDYIEICAGVSSSQEVYGHATEGHTRLEVYQLP